MSDVVSTAATVTGGSRPAPAQPRSAGQQVERSAEKAEAGARREEQRPSYRRLARVGLVARAVVYLLIGSLTIEIAVRGRSSSGPDSNGAFVEIARQPGGRVLLVVLAAGLFGYAAWRVLQGLAGCSNGAEARASRSPDEDAGRRRLGLRRKGWQRLGWLACGAVYLLLFGEAMEIVFGSSSSGGPGEHPDPIVRAVLDVPGGPGYVGLIGVGIAAGGIALLVWGAIHRYEDVLCREQLGDRAWLAARASGIAGDAARGLAVVLVGSYVLESAVTDDPSRARGIDGALQSMSSFPGGPELLGLIGAGMLAFGVYSLVEARYRRL